MINSKIIFNVLGVLLIIIGLFLLIPAAVAFYTHSEDAMAFVYSFLCVVILGIPLYKLNPEEGKIGKREGYLIVTSGWLTLCLAATLPYLFSHSIGTFTSAFFESTSGLTTTGATVFTNIESLPPGILLWRSLTQWIGGMGIIVLTVAIFPLLGIGGVELFVAEAPGPTSDKLHPRIKDTAKRLWQIYVGLTALLCILLYLVAGLTPFESVNHALTTMATGGFSTKDASMMAFGPTCQYIVTFFMFLAGMNYTIIYYGLSGKMKNVWRSDEFKTYLFGIIIVSLIVGISIYYSSDLGVEASLRVAAFQVLSMVTTTGYVIADYTSWNYGLTMLFFIFLFVGACAGSTSGGIKIIRHIVFFRNTLFEFKRLLHPRALIRIKIDDNVVSGKIITHILVFLLVYLILFIFGAIAMSVIVSDMAQPILTSIGSVATCLGNVGPGIGSVGPVDNFSAIPESGKMLLSIFMIIGRLELFTILIVLTPYFWRKN